MEDESRSAQSTIVLGIHNNGWETMIRAIRDCLVDAMRQSRCWLRAWWCPRHEAVWVDEHALTARCRWCGGLYPYVGSHEYYPDTVVDFDMPANDPRRIMPTPKDVTRSEGSGTERVWR